MPVTRPAASFCAHQSGRGNIYGVVEGHRDAMFMAAIESLDGAKPNNNPKTNPNPNTNLTVFLILPNTNPVS